MKRSILNIFLTLSLIFLFISGSNATMQKTRAGEGELFLNKKIIDEYFKYITQPRSKLPLLFFISDDQQEFYKIIIRQDNKGPAGASTILKKILKCEKELKQKCHVFSNSRFIVWDNGVNPVKKKHSKLNSKISYDDFTKKLNELGFINSNLKTTKTASSSTKKEPLKVVSTTKGDLDGFMNALEMAKNIGMTIDADSTAKQFGYKNFDEFFLHYKSAKGLADLTIEEAKDFLLGSDNTIKIVESQANLDKLYDLIMNNKSFVKYQKNKNSYLKTFKKGKYKKNILDQMALAVYIDYDKELSKISKDPNVDKISRFAWGWGWSRGSSTPFEWALKDCEDDAKKYKLSGGECIIVDYRTKNPEIVYNYLKPRLKDKKKKKIQIANEEPSVTSKKKVKVASVEEPKQEEFKPKSKNIDNEPPVIEIAENITVNKPDFEIEGKILDNSDKIFIEIDGITSEVIGEKFKIKRYSPVDQQIKIVAIDKFGNKSKEKIINVKVEIKDNKVVVLEPLNPIKIKSEINSSSVALIIGIEKYENTPAAKYASLDAKYFTEYSKNIFGVDTKNIKLLTDEQANLSNTNSAIFKWLPSKIKENQTDLIIFYSGHGLASADGKSKYILPSNVDPDLLSRTALSRNEFFDQIISLKPKSVTIFFDTCYSGVSRDEEMLLASAKPLMIVAEDENKLPDNFTIFTASKPDQISSGLKEAKHGIFSYYLMKGLEGNADINKDFKITNGELLAYMNKNVSEKALDLGRQQNPLLFGNESNVILTLN